jgi:hypothetical protein
MTIELTPIWGWLALLVAVAFIVASVLWSKWEVKRRREMMARQVAEFGLEPVPEDDPDLLQRWQRLERNRVNPPRIALAWKRDDSLGRLYVLELWMDNQNERKLQGEHLLVVSPRLGLPRFGLFPKVDLPRLIAPLARGFRDHVLGSLGLVAFEDHPEFERGYSVVGQDPAAIRQFLTEPRLRELARLPYRRLEADGNMFSYARSEPESRKVLKPWSSLRERIEEAQALGRIFETSRQP